MRPDEHTRTDVFCKRQRLDHPEDLAGRKHFLLSLNRGIPGLRLSYSYTTSITWRYYPQGKVLKLEILFFFKPSKVLPRKKVATVLRYVYLGQLQHPERPNSQGVSSYTGYFVDIRSTRTTFTVGCGTNGWSLDKRTYPVKHRILLYDSRLRCSDKESLKWTSEQDYSKWQSHRTRQSLKLRKQSYRNNLKYYPRVHFSRLF